MKKITSLLVFGLALLLSCEKQGPTTVNEITDLYTAPADAIAMSFANGKSTWSTDRRYFDLNFGNVTTTLVGYDALLAPGQYMVGADQIGSAINTKADGASVSDGFFTVGERDGKYQITAHLNGKVYFWEGTLPFTADPAPTVLTEVMSAQSNVPNGTNSVTMNLSTGGISEEMDWSTWTQTWVGEGNYLALDLYSEDGYLHDGTYKASAEGGVINPGEFGKGWDPGDIYGMGMEFTDWGTCWWTVKNGARTAEKISDGIVIVSSQEVDNEVIWTISWGAKTPVEVIFEGAIPALTKPKKPDGPAQLDYLFTEDELQPVSDQSGAVVSGVLKHPIHITDKNGNEKAYLELLIAEGETNYEGTYPSTSYASQPGQMADGWEFDGTAWGMGMMSGGSYYINDAGEKALLFAGTATVMVTKVAEGAYRFTCDFFDYAAAGPDYVPGEDGGEGDDDVTGDVILKITSGLTYTMEDVTAGNTAADGSALSGMTLWRVSVLNGADEVAEFDLGTAAGSQDLAGTYTVMSYPDAIGKAGNGWGFIPWMKGGCYFVVDGNYYWIPSDSTIKVSNNADGTLKIKFEGAIQNSDNTDGGTGGVLLNNIAKG